MKRFFWICLFIVQLNLIIKSSDGAICDSGFWPLDSELLKLTEKEFNEYLAVAKTLAQPLYEDWLEWKTSTLDMQKEGGQSETCSQFPFAPVCLHSLAGRTHLAKPIASKTRVVVADYELLRTDFGLELGGLSNEEIDEWIVSDLVFLSEEFAKKFQISSPNLPLLEAEGIRQSTDSSFVAVLDGQRPVVEVVEGYLGRVGELTLVEALHDYLIEKMVETLLLVSNVDAYTVGTYAVIDLGISETVMVAHPLHEEQSAQRVRPALLLKQVSRHAPTVGGLMTMGRTVQIEKVLRQFGMSSADAWFGLCEWRKSPLLTRLFPNHHLTNAEVEMAYMPASSKGDLLDCSTIKASESFDRHLAHWLSPVQSLIGASQSERVEEVALDVHKWGFDCRDQRASPFRQTSDKVSLLFAPLVEQLEQKEDQAMLVEDEDLRNQLKTDAFKEFVQLVEETLFGLLEDEQERIQHAVGDLDFELTDRSAFLDNLFLRCINSINRIGAPMSDRRLFVYASSEKSAPEPDVL